MEEDDVKDGDDNMGRKDHGQQSTAPEKEASPHTSRAGGSMRRHSRERAAAQPLAVLLLSYNNRRSSTSCAVVHRLARRLVFTWTSNGGTILQTPNEVAICRSNHVPLMFIRYTRAGRLSTTETMNDSPAEPLIKLLTGAYHGSSPWRVLLATSQGNVSPL